MPTEQQPLDLQSTSILMQTSTLKMRTIFLLRSWPRSASRGKDKFHIIGSIQEYTTMKKKNTTTNFYRTSKLNLSLRLKDSRVSLKKSKIMNLSKSSPLLHFPMKITSISKAKRKLRRYFYFSLTNKRPNC